MGDCSKDDANRFVELAIGHDEASLLSDLVQIRFFNVRALARFLELGSIRRLLLQFRTGRSVLGTRLDDHSSEKRDHTDYDEK